MKHITILLLFLMSLEAISCRPISYSDDERIKQAKHIYVGYVVGINLTGFEELKKEEILNDQDEKIVIPLDEDFLVLIKESLKGETKQRITVRWSDCANGGAELRNKVIVFRSEGYDYITEFNEAMYKKISSK